MKYLAFLFIFLSIWTDPFGETGVGALGRIVPADIAGLAVVLLFVLRGKPIKLDSISKSAFLVIILFLPGLVFSTQPFSTLLEIVIHLFLFIIYVVFWNIFKDERGFSEIVGCFALAGFFAAFIGLWNLMSTLFGVPAIPVLNPRATLVGIGTFRNTGQAGAYMGVVLAVLIPARLSSLYVTFSNKNRLVINLAIPLCLIFLIASTKRSALIGFMAGCLVWLLLNIKNFKFKKVIFSKIILALFLFLLVGSSFIYIFQKNEAMKNIFLYKWIEKTPNFFDEESFAMQNYSLAFQAFLDNPFFGSGIGGFAGRYSTHEVHSTYIKMIGEAGVAGVLGYLFFLVAVFKKMKLNLKGPYGDFIRNMSPFLIGLFISWGYTYHLRKREFWILLVIFTIASKLAHAYGNGKSSGEIVPCQMEIGE